MSLRTTPECFHVFGSGATATIVLIPAVPGKRVLIQRMVVTLGSGNTNVTLQDTSGAAMSQPFQGAANELIIFNMQANGEPWWTTSPGLGFQIGQSGTVTIGYDVWYTLW